MTEHEQADETQAQALLKDLHVPWCIGHERNVLAAFAAVRAEVEAERDEARAWLDAVLRAVQGSVTSDFEQSNPVVRAVVDLRAERDALTDQALTREGQLITAETELAAARAEPALYQDQLAILAGSALPREGEVIALKAEHVRLRELEKPVNIALADVWAERQRQDVKWGEQNHDPFCYLSILVEEVGEFAQAALHARFGGHAKDNMMKEAVHVAAVSLALVEALYRQKWSWGAHALTGGPR